MSSSGTTVLITGASSGIGAGLAREFARRGARVALVARRVDQLEALADELRRGGAQASAHRGDVTRDGDIAGVITELGKEGVVPDIVVANAGFGVVGAAHRLTVADYQRQFDTNVFGVVRTLHETIDSLRRTRGRFVIMGSAAAYASAPGGSAYAMSKFAVRALAESLHGDLQSAGIGVTLISPGFIDSDIRRVDNQGGHHADAPDPVPAWLRMRTHKAARVMARGILRGKREVIVTMHAKLLVALARHFPRITRFVLTRGSSRPEPGSG